MVKNEITRIIFDTFNKIFEHGLEYFGRYYSAYEGYVVSNKDPLGKGRIQALVPCIDPVNILNWAEPEAPAGPDCGFFFPPPEDIPDDPESRSIVFVKFRGGDPNYPIYTGGYWGGRLADGKLGIPKECIYTEETVQKRILKTPIGHYLYFDDTEDNETVRLVWTKKDGTKKSFLEFNKDGSIALTSANGSTLYLNAKDAESTFFGPADQGPAGSFGFTKDGLKAVGKDGQIFEFKPNTIFMNSGTTIQIIAAGAYIVIDQGKITLTGQSGTYMSIDGDKFQLGAAGGATITGGPEGILLFGANGESFSLSGGKVQMIAPGGPVVASGSGGFLSDSGAVLGKMATDHAMKAETFLASFDAHTHSHPMGLTGTPIVPLSTMLNMLAALKVKVE